MTVPSPTTAPSTPRSRHPVRHRPRGQPRGDRLPRDPHPACPGHPFGGRLQRCRRRCPARARSRRCRADRPGRRSGELPEHRGHHPGLPRDRRRGRPPRLRLPERERRLCPRPGSGRHHVHRPRRGVPERHGRQDPVQEPRGRLRRPGGAGHRRAGHDGRAADRGRGRRRLPAAHQALRGRRRQGHAHRGTRRGAAPPRWPPPGASPPAPSATTPCSWSGWSARRGTSRSRSWPTTTATSSIWASASARCSAATRKSSRKRRRRCWMH